MKAIKFLFCAAALILSSTHLSAQVTPSQNYFLEAKRHLQDMLEGKENLSFENAIFYIENAWWNGGVDYKSYQSSLDLQTDILRGIIASKLDTDRLRYHTDLLGTAEQKRKLYLDAIANYAIFQYMKKGVILVDRDMIIVQKPHLYSIADPLGTKDWTTTQVTHLINTHKGNCFALASLYKIFSERLQSNAKLCTAPGHIYIRHADDKGTFYNVELSSGSFPGTGTIEALTHTSKDATRNNIALRELDLKQSVALCLVYLAKSNEYKTGAKDEEFMLACAEAALNYDKHNLNAMLLKAEIMEDRLFRKNLAIAQLKTQKEFQDYQLWIEHIFDLGYREMPYDMKNTLIKGWTKDTIVYLASTAKTSRGDLNKMTIPSTRYASLSWGLFDEEIRTKPLERYGNTVFDTRTKQIVAFLQGDILYNQYNFDPVIFAWNVDPLAKSFASLSPYIFAQNSPIAMIDKQGEHGEIVITKTGNANQPCIAKVDFRAAYVSTVEREQSLRGDYSFYDKAKFEIQKTYGRQTFSGTSGNVAYNVSFNVTVKDPLLNEAALKAAQDRNPTLNDISFDRNEATRASGKHINFNPKQEAGLLYQKPHEISHTLGESGDDFKNNWMSSYSGDRNVQPDEVNQLVGPAIGLANRNSGSQVTIRFFSGTDACGDIGTSGGYNTYKVYNPDTKMYGESVTVPILNPQVKPASK